MSLNIIFGASGTGKSEYILSQAKEISENSGKVIIIVPEQFSHAKETELINKTGFITDNVKATSFKRLSYEALKRAGEIRKNPDRIKKNIFAAKAIYDVCGKLSLFAKVHKKPGFVSVIQNLISDFKRSSVMPSDVLEMAEGLKEGTLFKMKLNELAVIYEKYQSLLGDKFLDDDDNISYLAKLIENKADLKGTKIFIDEFFRFTVAELQTIEAFLKAGADVIVSLCTPVLNKDRCGLFAPVISTYYSLLNCAKNSRAEVLPPICMEKKYRFENSKELSFLELEFPKYKYNTYNEETHDIFLFAASDVYSEVTYLACRIKESVMKYNLRYKDIAIICGETETYKNIIKTVFEIYDIPIFLDTKRDILSHPVIIMISSVFDIMINGMDTKYILSYIKSGYSTLNREETDFFENFILSGNIRKGDFADDEKFLKRARSVFEDSEDLKETNTALAEKAIKLKQKLLLPLDSLKEKMSQSRKVNDRVDAFSSFFENIALFDRISEKATMLADNGDYDLAKEYAEVYNIILQTMESVAVCLNGESIGLERLFDLISAGFSECKIGVIPPVNDGVFFGDLSRSIARNVKQLHIIGANDGAFPPKAQNEGILNDEERILLQNRGMFLAPDTKKIIFDYDFMMYNTINISKEKLFISYPVSDLSGGGLRPSALVKKIKNIFPDLSFSSDVDGKKQLPEEYIFSKKSAFNYLLGIKYMTDSDKVIYEKLTEDEKYKKMLLSAKEKLNYKKEAQRLSPDVVKNLYHSGLKGSVSSFEKYSGCPFSYFITYGLSAKERKLFDIDTPDFGSLLHKVIDIFSKEVVNSEKGFKDITKEDCENEVNKILDEIVEKMFIKKLYSEKKMFLLVKRLKKYAFRAAWAMCVHIKKGDFVPCAFEAEFSQNGEMAPVEIELPTGDKITLIGKIDRIDKFEKDGELYIKVIDYKTGKKDFSLSDIYNKLSLQLCVYITAVCDNGDAILGKNPKPAGMFYFKLSDNTVKAMSKDDVSEDQYLDSYKMSGIVLDDKEIIEAMERDVSGASKILPISFNKAGEIMESRSKIASAIELDTLKNYVKKVAGEIGREILNGKVDILPYHDGKNTACTYCKYHSICAFDEEEDSYRQIGTIKDDAVWELMKDN